MLPNACQVAAPVSTLTLSGPEKLPQAACTKDKNGPYHSLTLQIGAQDAVPGATGYEVNLTGPSGETATQYFDSATTVSVKKRGDWSYTIRAVRAMTADNKWTGPGLPARLCQVRLELQLQSSRPSTGPKS